MPDDFYGRPRDIPTALEWQAGVIEAALERRDGALTETERLEATDALIGCVRELPAWLRAWAKCVREQEPEAVVVAHDAAGQPVLAVGFSEEQAAPPPEPSVFGIGAVAGRHPGMPVEGPRARGGMPKTGGG